jgi:hypothetical protein
MHTQTGNQEIETVLLRWLQKGLINKQQYHHAWYLLKQRPTTVRYRAQST